MALISQQDGEAISLPPELILYVRNLNEPIEKYSPYFDALLIRRRDHEAFFRDLKDFRCQAHVIALLTDPHGQQPQSTPEAETPKVDLKQMYRHCSKVFLASRFAHPWCRKTPSKDGWFRAEWPGRTKKQSEAKRKEEERLHKLLVPIWCGFRVRMMPNQEQLDSFLAKEAERNARLPIQLPAEDVETRAASTAVDKRLDSSVGPGEEATIAAETEDARSESQNKRRQTIGEVPRRFNAEAYVMEDDERAYEELRERSQEDEGAAAAAKLFVGFAATSFLAENRRARKYLLKKLNKKK
jgi:hypothetical protein